MNDYLAYDEQTNFFTYLSGFRRAVSAGFRVDEGSSGLKWRRVKFDLIVRYEKCGFRTNSSYKKRSTRSRHPESACLSDSDRKSSQVARFCLKNLMICGSLLSDLTGCGRSDLWILRLWTEFELSTIHELKVLISAV